MRCWENFKATMKPTDEKDYKRRMTRGFVIIASFCFILQWSGITVGSLFGGMRTVWVKPPYRADSNLRRFLYDEIVRPTTIGQSTRMIVRPAVWILRVLLFIDLACSRWCCLRRCWYLDGTCFYVMLQSQNTIRGKNDWWTHFVSGASAGAVVGLSV